MDTEEFSFIARVGCKKAGKKRNYSGTSCWETMVSIDFEMKDRVTKLAYN